MDEQVQIENKCKEIKVVVIYLCIFFLFCSVVRSGEGDKNP